MLLGLLRGFRLNAKPVALKCLTPSNIVFELEQDRACSVKKDF